MNEIEVIGTNGWGKTVFEFGVETNDDGNGAKFSNDDGMFIHTDFDPKLSFDGHEIPLARLAELAAAEREGRVVVLPCKVDTLRRSIDANVSEEVCLVEAEGLSRYGNCHLTCFDCYVNALAKAEAEAALAGKGETK